MNITLGKQTRRQHQRQGEPQEGDCVIATGMQLYEALVAGAKRENKRSEHDLSGFDLIMQNLYRFCRVLADRENRLREFDEQDALLLPVQFLNIDESTPGCIVIKVAHLFTFSIPGETYALWREQSEPLRDELTALMLTASKDILKTSVLYASKNPS